MSRFLQALTVILLTLGGAIGWLFSGGKALVNAQQPTGSIPTVTGTPSGMIVGVNLDIETVQIYSGPSSYLYPAVGILLKGQEVPAFGISEDGDWIQVAYPGVPESVAWIFGPYVTIKKTGKLPVLPAPPTPTPLSTPTINPTLAAAFITPVAATRLPTFTQPAPLSIAAFESEPSAVGRVPLGLLIFSFGVIGGFGTLLSFLRGR